MPLRPLALAAGLAAALAGAPVLAQTPTPQAECKSVSDAGLPPTLAAWKERVPYAVGPTEVEAVNLPVGVAVEAQLKQTRAVSFPVPPSKASDPMSYGGIYALRIYEAGDYQVSLGAEAWVELVTGYDDRSLVTAKQHGHGPACSSLKKTVVFPLARGRYYLAITGAEGPVLPVMVSRAP